VNSYSVSATTNAAATTNIAAGTCISSVSTFGIASTNANNYIIANSNGPTKQTYKINTDVKIDGNLTVKGHDIGKLLEGIESRLCILIPDPDKLEKFESLQKAYQHYKLLEALCHDE